MGLEISYFYSLTPREFDNILSGYRRREDALFRDRWDRTRNIMWAALAPHQKKGSGFTPQKLMPMPWDKEDVPHLEGDASAESIQAVRERWAERDRKLAEKAAKGELQKRTLSGREK